MTNEELVLLIQAGDREKLVDLWNQVKRFVFKEAAKWAAYGGGGATLEDLLQAGFIALLRAVETFDPSKAKLTTHLTAYLKAEFTLATGQRTKREQLDPLQDAYSLDFTLDSEEHDGFTLSDLIPDPRAKAALGAVDEQDWLSRRHAALEAALATLPAEEQRAIRAHYYQGKTLEEIAAAEGVHKGTVWMWEQKAIRCLRHPSRSRALMEYW